VGSDAGGRAGSDEEDVKGNSYQAFLGGRRAGLKFSRLNHRLSGEVSGEYRHCTV
jgi:hypothetical protein